MKVYQFFHPVPLPTPDFTATEPLEVAMPVITRSMTSLIPKCSDIEPAFLHSPPSTNQEESDRFNSDDNDSDGDDDSDDHPSDGNDDVDPPISQKPTTTTPADRPSLPVYYKQFSSAPKVTRLTTHELHSMLGSRSLKNWKDVDEISLPTVQIANTGAIPLELGDVTNMKSARRNKTPIPRPRNFLDVVHCDLAYGDCATIGGVRYVLMIVDRATRYTWTYGLKSLVQEEIIKGFVKLKLAMGKLPKRVYADFDHRLLSGLTEKYLNEHDCSILGAPASRQHQKRTSRAPMANTYEHGKVLPFQQTNSSKLLVAGHPPRFSSHQLLSLHS